MKISKRLMNKVESGANLSKKELSYATAFYDDLVESLDCLGKEFNLAKRPLRVILYRLENLQIFIDSQ